MGKKISARIVAPGEAPYRAYHQETEREDGTRLVLVWRAGTGSVGFKVDRFNGGVFSRDWVRALYRSDVRVEF